MDVFDILFQGQNFVRLLLGLWVTIRIALISSVLSIALGTGFGLLLRVKIPYIRLVGRIYVEFFRIMPQLVLLFVGYYTLETQFSAEAVAVIVFTLWGTAEMGDLVRGATENVDVGQVEAGKTIGLSKLHLNLHIVLPQAFRQLVPVSINLVTRIIKTTAIVPLIGIVEVLKVGQQIIDYNRITSPTASIPVYALIFILYFLICWPLSKLATACTNRS
jgi:polar amino acid transport system permease protein